MQTFTMILRPEHIDAPGWKPGDPIPPGYVPESFHCIDCGADTGPGIWNAAADVELVVTTATTAVLDHATLWLSKIRGRP
jgi:hypothetical protein